MTINVTSCGDCIFRTPLTKDDGSIKVDICNLIKIKQNIQVVVAAYEYEDEASELKTTLSMCPLKEQEVIVKLNV